MPQPPDPNQNIEQLRESIEKIYNESRRMAMLRTGSPITYLTDEVLFLIIKELEDLESLPNIYPEIIKGQYTHVEAIYKSAITNRIAELKQTPPTPNGDEQGGLARPEEAKSE